MRDIGGDVSMLAALVSTLTTKFSVRSENVSYSGRKGTYSVSQPSAQVALFCSNGDRSSSLFRILFLLFPSFKTPLLVSFLTPFE